jgi:hypothetical protein
MRRPLTGLLGRSKLRDLSPSFIYLGTGLHANRLSLDVWNGLAGDRGFPRASQSRHSVGLDLSF